VKENVMLHDPNRRITTILLTPGPICEIFVKIF
jgi:hypothetical protein